MVNLDPWEMFGQVHRNKFTVATIMQPSVAAQHALLHWPPHVCDLRSLTCQGCDGRVRCWNGHWSTIGLVTSTPLNQRNGNLSSIQKWWFWPRQALSVSGHNQSIVTGKNDKIVDEEFNSTGQFAEKELCRDVFRKLKLKPNMDTIFDATSD